MKLFKQKRGPGIVYCIHCGRRILPEYHYCIFCGKSTESNPKCNADRKEQDAMLDVFRGELDTIAETAPKANDAQIEEAFHQIHGKLLEVYKNLEDDRKLMKRKSVRSLIEIYLPGIIQVLEKYISLQDADSVAEELAETRGSFRSVLDSLDISLDQLLEELHGEDIMDMEVNLEVLDHFLKRI